MALALFIDLFIEQVGFAPLTLLQLQLGMHVMIRSSSASAATADSCSWNDELRYTKGCNVCFLNMCVRTIRSSCNDHCKLLALCTHPSTMLDTAQQPHFFPVPAPPFSFDAAALCRKTSVRVSQHAMVWMAPDPPNESATCYHLK